MEKFLNNFIEKSSLSCLIKSNKVNPDSNSNVIGLIQKIVFKPDVLNDFIVTLSSACSSEEFTVKNNSVKKILTELSSLLFSDRDDEIKIEVFCRTFDSFSLLCKNNESSAVLQFFVVLCRILGFEPFSDEKSNADECFPFPDKKNFQTALTVNVPDISSFSYVLLHKLFLHLSKININMSSNENQIYFKWVQGLIKIVANSENFGNLQLDVISACIDVDFRLVESNLDHIFKSILSENKFLCSSFCNSYDAFMNKSLSAFSKFQRGLKFISKVLSIIRTYSSNCDPENILSEKSLLEFSNLVQTTSNRQALSLMEILLDNIKEDEFIVFCVTSKLLISFLRDVKIYAPSISVETITALINNLNNLKRILQDMSEIMLSNVHNITKDPDKVKLFLEICFYCGEIDIMISCYSGSLSQSLNMSHTTKDQDWQCCINLKQWNLLADICLKYGRTSYVPVCVQLAFQRLRTLKLKKEKLNSEEITLKVILVFYDVNYQNCREDDIIVFVDFSNQKQLKSMAKKIVRNCLRKKVDMEVEQTWAWLSNPRIQENSKLMVSLFLALLKETGVLLDKVASRENQFSWLLEDYFDKKNKVDGYKLKKLTGNINNLLSNWERVGKVLINWPEEKNALISVVKALELLPLVHLDKEFRKLGLVFSVAFSVVLSNEETVVQTLFETVSAYLGSDTDPSECFHIGLYIKWLSEISFNEKEPNELRLKLLERLIKNCPNTATGLHQIGVMIEESENNEKISPLSLETKIILHQELGKCWQRAKKRKSENDIVGNYRNKLAKIITEEAQNLNDGFVSEKNYKIKLKIFAIELHKSVKTNEPSAIADLINSKFSTHFDFAVTKLDNGFDDVSISFLIMILQYMPKIREYVPNDSFIRIWKALRIHGKVDWHLFCKNGSDEEFELILSDLLHLTKVNLRFELNHSPDYFHVWIPFIENSTGRKAKSCQIRLQELFLFIRDCYSFLTDFTPAERISLTKFFCFCITNTKVICTPEMIDVVLDIILRNPDNIRLSVENFQQIFTLEIDACSAIFTKRFTLNRNRIHLSFALFRHALRQLTERCESPSQTTNEEIIILSRCSFSLEKWASFLVEQKKDFTRVVPYFLTLLISSIASVTIPSPVKIHLVNCINHFLSISDSHTVSYLLRVLKPGFQQIFSGVYDQFKRYHKYSGKV